MTIAVQQQQLLSRSQGANRLGVSGEMVNKWRRAGQLQAVPTPLGFLYEIGEVETFEAARKARRAASENTSH